MARKKTMNFKSKKSYKKWAAWGATHNKAGRKVTNAKSVFKTTKGNTPVRIKGKVYRPKHKK
ncbi:uncharacterized protein METZ01_LOCUS333351 [marine metagenome]|uniref:Uncharacterized protein n=1 Tax=marine metagenome TaxID=408172 RepID=A0A382Q633_9ZZZZ